MLIEVLGFLIPLINLVILIYLILEVKHSQKVTSASIAELKSEYKAAAARIGNLEDLIT